MTFLGRDSGMSNLNSNILNNFSNIRDVSKRIFEYSPFQVSSSNGFKTQITNKLDFERFCNSLYNGEG